MGLGYPLGQVYREVVGGGLFEEVTLELCSRLGVGKHSEINWLF